MEIKIINEQTAWDAFIKKNNASFLQSFAWGEVLIGENKQVERLAVIDGGEVLAQAEVVYNNLPFGNKYVFCGGGPVVKYQVSSSKYQAVIESLAEYFKNKKIIFLRLEPQYLIPDTKYLIRKVNDVNPSNSAVTDLAISEEEFFAGMNKKTRHDAKKADKQDLFISEEKNLEIFWKLMQGTAKRDGFSAHEKMHYETVLNSPSCHQLTAFYQGLPVATVILFGYNLTLTYLFAAADYNYHQLLASYRLQLEAFRLGKKLGYKYYDWFGIAPRSRKQENKKTINQSDDGEYEYDLKHRYAGITRFKLGFGGQPSEAPGTFDLAIKPWQYRVYRILKLIRTLI